MMCYKVVAIFIKCMLALAYDDLSKNKVATQSTTALPVLNDAYRFVASNAVDRNKTTCMRTNPIGIASDKTVWWKVDLGGVYNIYSVNILFKYYDGYEMRQQGRFAGFSLFISNNGSMNSSSLCYKDGPQLPSLNFTTTCITSGRYVTFYNERLDGATYPEGYQLIAYTELCEVVVQGCKAPGVYGDGCHERCPTNCKDNVCHIQKGTCFGCDPGWNGTTCNIICITGWYGVDCKQQCSGHCRENAACYHVTGQCDEGCAAGWTGSKCNKECKHGTYGNNCVHNCSGNCLNDSLCNKQTGHCEGGCKPGYTNKLCDEHCLPGYYGNKCEQSCSGHCLNNLVCDHIDGTCSDGCEAGYIGKLCNTSCRDGYFGQNCSSICPTNCRACKATDGMCECYAGWRRPDCTIDPCPSYPLCNDRCTKHESCLQSYGENCQYPCSKHCVNQTCNRFNGICQFGCESGYHGQKCDQEYPSTSCLSSGFIGASVSACVFITTAVLIFIIRRKKLCFSGRPSVTNKESPYAEIDNQQSGASRYQELTVPEKNKDYQNLALQ